MKSCHIVDALDSNHSRYCGEYLDFETGDYYLSARYYDPTIGRFTQQDTHWNTANMIYGDSLQKINQLEDKLGLKTYSYAPQLTAVMQSGNLYVYAINNPVNYLDPSGNIALVDDLVVAGLVFLGAAAVYTATPLFYAISNSTASFWCLVFAVFIVIRVWRGWCSNSGSTLGCGLTFSILAFG